MPSKFYKCCVLAILAISLIILSGCRTSKPPFELRPISYSRLPNWNKDHLKEAWPAFIRSCYKLNKLPKDTVFLNNTTINGWHKVCSSAIALDNPTEVSIRKFFETHFTPYKVTTATDEEGLFTGYYEPELRGSRSKKGRFKTPLYKKPNDLVVVEDLGIFRKELKGVRLAGRLVNGNLKPYYTHAEIDRGLLAGNELLWIEDPIDAFFIQIQGSSAIRLDNGELIRLNYAGANGHPYSAIGKFLIAQNELTNQNVSMQSIRAWLKEHPNQAKALLYQNASFVFFKEIKSAGPIGGQGVILTPGRSLAVDTKYISYGTPIWLNIDHSIPAQRIQRMVIAQDKGGAIKSPVRGDLFWGTGSKAGEQAGLMKSKGSYYVLLPNLRTYTYASRIGDVD